MVSSWLNTVVPSGAQGPCIGKHKTNGAGRDHIHPLTSKHEYC